MPDHPCDPPAGKPRHPSSYQMQDPEAVFRALRLEPGDAFLDAGCGRGEYAMEAARMTGPAGRVHALDISAACIEYLRRLAASRDLGHLRAEVADITRPLPLPDASITVCLLATVLHIPAISKATTAVLLEVLRVLKPGGRLGVIGTHPASPRGQPQSMRRPAAPAEDAFEACGFRLLAVHDLGNTYLALFQKPDGTPTRLPPGAD